MARSSMPPTFLIAGAMRCGTSSLNAYLREHPEISVSQPKEVHFFDANFDRGMDWYLDHFPAPPGKAIGEATPDYLYDENAAIRIASTLPEVRILLLLRDPAARAHSHYWHNRSVGHEVLEFDEAIREEPGRISASAEGRVRYSYVDRGRYAAQLERLLESVPAANVLIQTFDELQEDPEDVFKRTCRFLGVDDGFVPEIVGSQVNAFVKYRSPGIRQATKKLPKKLKNAVAKLNRIDSDPYPPMSRHTAEFIRAKLADDTSRLVEMVDFEIPWARTAR